MRLASLGLIIPQGDPPLRCFSRLAGDPPQSLTLRRIHGLTLPIGLIGGTSVVRVYSLRSVSIGSTDAAWRAGT
jgi:hypothetical protein